MSLKINILHSFVKGPYGGGNQFLSALKNQLISTDNYTETCSDADVILFNAHQHPAAVISSKKAFPQKIFAHRMDGLYKLYNHQGDTRQNTSIRINKFAANCTVFQNNWSKKEYANFGFTPENPCAIISNAPDKKIFNKRGKEPVGEKIKLVSTSWSTNKNKGFGYYNYLDKNLDFSKYSFTYIGQDPGLDFKNIKKIGPFNSGTLARHLKQHDIFITGSRHECCSNSLLEAMACGLAAVGLDSGGTPEIIGEGGELFKTGEDLLVKIDKVSSNLHQYTKNIKIPSISKIAKDYLDFFSERL